MKLKEIRRTATFAWSPTSTPLLATGTVAGALDDTFSNDSQLEIWEPDFMDKLEYDLGGEHQKGPQAVVTTSSRFNRLAWGYPSSRTYGVLAAGMENGELVLWDPEKILANKDATDALILRNTTHQGSVRGLDFNPKQENLLSSGGINGEIYIWDLKDPSKPYSPGTRSSKLDEITSLAWNRQVQHVLASSSSTGYTVVWDLRNKREVVALQYSGSNQAMHAMGGAGRKGMSDVVWHPDNATRLVTSSEDDNSPVVMVWDLRNARAPEKLLTGHEKGVLSLSWCAQDPDLLLSCGKDNRALCWNPQTAEIIGELPCADNWAFEVQWCPKNPDLLATAYFDGTIGVHSLQSTNDSSEASQATAPAPQADGSDVFDVPGFSRTAQATLSLKQPPKWLRRPVSSSFGYGGKLVSVSNLPSEQGTNQSSVVHVRSLVTEPTIVERAKKLQEATTGKALESLAQEKTRISDDQTGRVDASWKALSTLFTADSRDELVALLGFSKAESAARVAEAVEKIKANVTPTILPHVDIDYSDHKPHEPMVSFAEPETTPPTPDAELTPSEQSVSVTSFGTESTQPVDGESTTTVPSLFDDELVGTPQLDAEVDFFSSMGTIRSALPDHNQIPHQNYAHDSSVAATVGSRPSSSASESMKSNTFRIYPSEESDIDKLVTKSLILGDFEAAVTLCLSTERYADAILLAVKGGPELLQRTQKAYFEKRTVNLPYLRLFQSIVTEDLDDIVQNADLQEWQEIFVVLCTFAKADDFANLAEQLGQRLEFQASLMRNMENTVSEELRRHATLAYLAAGRLEKVVNIWIEEMSEDENTLLGDFDEKSSSRYSAHAHALQTFMEKVAIFRDATKYVDEDINAAEDNAALRNFKLSGLYERYFEYADLLAAQGLLDEAVSYLKLVPSKYESNGNSDFDFSIARDRVLQAAGQGGARAKQSASGSSSTKASSSTANIAMTSRSNYQAYVPPQSVAVPQSNTNSLGLQATNTYTSFNSNGSAVPSDQPPANPYLPPVTSNAPAYRPAPPMQPYGAPPYSSGHYGVSSQNSQILPPPPPPASASQVAPPPPPKKPDGHWNDPPVLSDRRTPASHQGPKAAVISSPFPNTMPSPQSGPGSPANYGQALPPPPRPGSVNRGPSHVPPPPGHRAPPPPMSQQGPPRGPPPTRAFSPSQGGQQMPGRPTPPPQRAPSHFAPPPPPQGRAMSPPQNQGPPRGGQYMPSLPAQAPGMPPSGPPPGGPYGRPPPSQSWSGPPGQNQGGFTAGSPRGPQGPLPPSGSQPSMYTPAGNNVPPSHGPPPSSSALGIHPATQRSPPPSGPPRSTAQTGPGSAPRPAPVKQAPPPPKYPPGDRSHIPPSSRETYEILQQELDRLKQTSMPPQKRIVDDIERRLNALFDALNCDTLSPTILEPLGDLAKAMGVRDQGRALGIHADLLQQGSRVTRPEDNIGLWMTAVRQLIMRL